VDPLAHQAIGAERRLERGEWFLVEAGRRPYGGPVPDAGMRSCSSPKRIAHGVLSA
jgi:hypothetical protein